MNERIKQLMDQAGIDVEAVENLGEMPTALKFAELIIRECASIDFYKLAHIGTEDDYNVTRVIKQHFGVKE